MFSLLCFYIHLLSVLSLLTLRTRAFATRDVASDIVTTKGGILVKNGKQTSCELGVIDSTAAFVAASCLDFSGTSVNQTTTYEVYLDAGIDNSAASYTVSSITVHPDYNATFNLNPIAVLQFNKGSTETWSNPIAIDQEKSWDSVLYISRGLLDVDSMEWRTPLTSTSDYSDAKNCTYYTRIFEVNINDLVCTNATAYPPYTYLTNCAIPYGSVDAYISNSLYVAGFYAYTDMENTGFECTLHVDQDSVYLLFADYIAFANKALGRSIGYYPNSNGVSPQSDSGYSMTMPSSMSLIMTTNGDFYANQTDSSPNGGSSGVSGSVDQSQGSSNSNSDANNQSNAINSNALSETGDSLGDSQDSSSKKVAIIGVVCGILGGIILTCLVLFFIRRWKKKHNNIYDNKETRVDMHEMLVVDANDCPSLATIRMHPELTPKPAEQPPANIFERDHFDIMDYDLPPLYERNAPTRTAEREHRNP